MASRSRRLGPGSSSRFQTDHRGESFRGRQRGEAPSLRGREGRFDVTVHKKSSLERSPPEREEGFRGREEPPKFRDREEPPPPGLQQESARERIRRENEQLKRSKDRSRSRNRRGSSGRRSRSRGRRSRSGERRSRSMDRKGRSAERRSGGLRFEPPDHQRQEIEFDRRPRSASNDRRARYRPSNDDVRFVKEGPNRFSPPVPEEFHNRQFNKGEFESRTSFNQDVYMGMSENVPLNGPIGGGSMVMNSRGFPDTDAFVASHQNAYMNQSQLLMGKPEYSHGPGMKPEFSHGSTIDQGFPPSQDSFADDPLQTFPLQLGGASVNSDVLVIPEFNPETSKVSSHEWVRVIEDAAKQYNWKKDEKQYIMASRLSGFARQWYLTSGISCKNWNDLKFAFCQAFPTEMGFYALLQKMLARTKDDGETMASYFHHKVALLNACEILGRKAVSCIIAGLPNGKLRQQAKMQNFEDPDELYLYLRSCDPEVPVKKPQKPPAMVEPKNKNAKATVGQCYYCKAVGHLKNQCPRRKAQGDQRHEERDKEGSVYNNRVMHGSLARKPTYPKYFTDVGINGIILKGYIDQGSESTTIREENSNFLKLPVKKQYKVIRGFGGSSISSIGVVDVPICIDRAIANVKLHVVPDHLQAIPVIVGQGFTEQPHVVVMKDGDKIRFYQRMDNGETNFDF